MVKPDVYDRKMVDVLSPNIKEMIENHYTVEAFKMTGCTREDNFAGQGVIPACEMARNSVFKSSTELDTLFGGRRRNDGRRLDHYTSRK
ncbi:hypothetical protein LCGC14_3022640 [marine sediment metagenome]|uniref:Uncharacterized protein n=1 Tax=marine sediment metagenome TaxID=412755 RepID=A0A0F8Z2E6_9ZZZZ